MIVVYRGAGMLAPGFGLLFALTANVLTFRMFGASYYEEHKWPKFSVLIMAGLTCLVVGTLIKRKRKRDAYLEQQAIDSLRPKNEIAKLLAFSGPRDHLMFIPLQYWSIVYFVAAVIYVLLGAFASNPSMIVEKDKSSSFKSQTIVEQRDQTTPVTRQTVMVLPPPHSSEEYRNLLFVDQRLEELITRHALPDDPFAKAYLFGKRWKRTGSALWQRAL